MTNGFLKYSLKVLWSWAMSVKSRIKIISKIIFIQEVLGFLVWFFGGFWGGFFVDFFFKIWFGGMFF